MILNNYYKWLGAQEFFGDRSFDSTTGAKVGVVDITGEITPMLFDHANQIAAYNFSLGSDTMTGEFQLVECQLGTGTGDFDPDDYTLANDVSSNFTGTGYSFSYSVANHKLSRVMTFTRTNASENAITIKQVGILKVLKQKDTSSGDWTRALIAEFNITPVTVPAGSTVTITVNFDEQE